MLTVRNTMLTIQSLVLLFQEAPETRAANEAREQARWAEFRTMLRGNTHDDVTKTFKKPKGADRHPFVVACIEQGVMVEKSAQNRLSEMRSIIRAYDLGMPLDAVNGWKSAVALADETRKAEKEKQAERAAKAERDAIRNAIVAQVQATNPNATVAELESAVDAAQQVNTETAAYEQAEQDFADATSDAWRALSAVDVANILADRCDLSELLPALQAIHDANQKQATVIEAAPVTVEKLLARA